MPINWKLWKGKQASGSHGKYSIVFHSVSVASRGSASPCCQMLFPSQHDIKRWIPLQGLLQDDSMAIWSVQDLFLQKPACCSRSCGSMALRFHPAQQDWVKHLPWNGQQCYISVTGAGAEIIFFGKLDEVTLLPLCWYPLSQILLKRASSLSWCRPSVHLLGCCQVLQPCHFSAMW